MDFRAYQVVCSKKEHFLPNIKDTETINYTGQSIF
jgi:hypothetical protein